MDGIRNLITPMLLVIPLIAALRGIYCCIVMAMDAEQAPQMKKRLWNMVKFVIIAESAVSLLLLIKNYVA